jgi:hypothetical protein
MRDWQSEQEFNWNSMTGCRHPKGIRVAEEVISVCLEMEIDSGVFPDWRVNDFRRRSCLNQPDAQVIEDGPYYLAVLNEADDPHDSLTFLADQGIYFVDLLYQSRPVPTKDLFIPCDSMIEGTASSLPSISVFQLCHPALPQAFRPLKTLP